MRRNRLIKILLFPALVLASLFLHSQSLLNVDISKTNPTTNAPFSGMVAFSINGGLPPYRVEYCGNYVQDTIVKGLKAGEHVFQVSDSLEDKIYVPVFLTVEIEWDTLNIGFSKNVLFKDNDGNVQFEVDGDTSAMQVGFARESSVNTVDTTISIGFLFAGGIYKVAVDDSIFDVPVYLQGYKAEDVFKISRRDQEIRFYKNGALVFVRAKSQLASNSAYRFGSSKFDPLEQIPIGISNIGIDFGYSNNYCDNDRIWVLERSFDEYGNIVAESKIFYDQLGRVVQTQVKNETENNVLVSENIYDRYGRLGISTLPAPINISSLCYSEGFILSLDGAYDYTAYDINDYPKKQGSATSGSIFNPKPVFAGVEGTLGWYYSNFNYKEPFVATTSFPYSRVEYSNDPRSIAEKNTMPGDYHSLGKGHEKESYIVSGGNEMDFIYGKLTSYETDASQSDPFSFPYYPRNSKDGYNPIPTLKTVNFDENGKEVLSYTSTRGGVLASCASGMDGGYCNNESSQIVEGASTGVVGAAARFYYATAGYYNDDPELSRLNVGDKNAIDLHLAKIAKSRGIDIFFKIGFEGWTPAYVDPNGFEITIIDLRNDKILVSGTDYQLNYNLASNTAKINFIGSELLASSIYRISVKLFKPETLTEVNDVPINYAIEQLRYTEIRYGIDYSNWSLNYYDKNTAQLLKSISPKDFICSYSEGGAKADISYLDADPDNNPFESYNRATQTFNIGNNVTHPTVVPVAPVEQQYIREQEITIFLGQKYFPSSAFYTNQPPSVHDELIPFYRTPFDEENPDANACDFINHELSNYEDPFTSRFTQAINPAKSNIDLENLGVLLNASTNSGGNDVRDNIVIERSFDEVTSAMFYDPDVSGGSNGSGLPSIPSTSPADWCDYWPRTLDMYKYPFHAQPYCQLAFGDQGILDNYSYLMHSEVDLQNAYTKPYVMHESTARGVFNGCVDGTNCQNYSISPNADLECDGLISNLINFKLRVSVTALGNDGSGAAPIKKYTIVNASVMEGCCKLLWYNFEPVRVRFTELELTDRDKFETKIENIWVEQSKEMIDIHGIPIQHGEEEETEYPTYVQNISYNWDPNRWQYNNLLAWTDMTISSNTKYYKALPMEHVTSQAYAYDEHGRVIGNYSQDEGISEVKYSDANEIRYTQNALQRETNSFSYVDYDDYGRPKETGEYTYNETDGAWGYFLSSLGLTDPKPSLATDVGDLFRNANYISTTTPGRTEVVNYFYDIPDASFPVEYASDYVQHFTDNALSYVSYNGGDNKTWYSYDEYGRSEWGMRLIDGLGYKTADFRYSLLGNMLVSAYQKDDPDESYYEAYTYDRDLRLSKAYVSTTGTLNGAGQIDVDLATATKVAEYKYYLHGPLKRVELGDKLQGIDYVYTVQGWLKSINTPNIGVAANRDPGRDGNLIYIGANAAGKYNPANYKVDDSRTAYDVFGMTLDYFPGDYIRNGTSVQTFTYPDGMLPYTGNAADNPANFVDFNNFKPHYNGLVQSVRYSNVSAVTELNQLIDKFHIGTINDPPADNRARMHFYEYDAMYRLKSSVHGSNPAIGTWNNTAGTTPSNGKLTFKPMADYMEWDMKYDLNGNMKQLKRNGANGTDLYRDKLTFNYPDIVTPSALFGNTNYTVKSNRLDYVTEAVTGQSVNQPELHGYSGGQNTGNYEYDVLGRITKDNKKNILIAYNYLGKVKTVKHGTTLLTKVAYEYDEAGTKLKKTEYNTIGQATRITWYVGNIIYEDEIGDGLPLAQTEVAIAGVGTQFMGVTLGGERIIGQIQFDIKDHLGNVRVNVLNQRNSQGMPIVTGRYDYYSYGGLMPGRTLNPIGTQDHRNGYQGQEWDATLGMYSFDLRMYEPEFGRWLSADPMRQHYSPYLAMSNNPVSFVDPTGGSDGGISAVFVDGVRYDLVTTRQKQEVSDYLSNNIIAIAERTGYFWLKRETYPPGLLAVYDLDLKRDLNLMELGVIPGKITAVDFWQERLINPNLSVNDVSIMDRLTQADEDLANNVTNFFLKIGRKLDMNSEEVVSKKVEPYAVPIGNFVVSMTPGGATYTLVTGEDMVGNESSRALAAVGLVPWGKLWKFIKGADDAANAGKEIFKFTNTAAKHMDEVERMIPVQTLEDIIEAPMVVMKDPQGTSAFMYYSQMWKNGKLYNVEVLYDKISNTIMHFKYSTKVQGPLPALPK